MAHVKYSCIVSFKELAIYIQCVDLNFFFSFFFLLMGCEERAIHIQNKDKGNSVFMCNMRNYIKLCLFSWVPSGDFDIPSSREDVDRDSSWNQWLRSEIPQLFLQAMDVFSVSTEWHRMRL